jgi:hypothetical protein
MLAETSRLTHRPTVGRNTNYMRQEGRSVRYMRDEWNGGGGWDVAMQRSRGHSSM